MKNLSEKKKFQKWFEENDIKHFGVSLNPEVYKITDSERLAWLVENIDHKPAGYDGASYGRHDMMWKSEISDLITAIDIEILNSKRVAINEKIYGEINRIIKNVEDGNFEEYNDF
jgi:hypothetical protein